MHVLSTCAFDTRQESAGKNNFCKTYPDRVFPNTSTHVLIYATLLKWVLADQYFCQILLDREPPNVSMRVLVYAYLIRDVSWQVENYRQTYLYQNFQFFNVCFEYMQLWYETRFGRSVFLPNTFGSRISKYVSACFDICNFDTRWDLADQYFCRVLLDRESLQHFTPDKFIPPCLSREAL